MAKSPVNRINASGFLFQVAVEDAIQRTYAEHGWHVVAREVPWRDEHTESDRFIDMVLAQNDLRLVIECKRPRESDWIFLDPDWSDRSDPNLQSWLRCRWIQYRTETSRSSQVSDIEFNPKSPHSEFCIVRGESDKDRGMLEHTASALCRAVDYLAAQDLARFRKAGLDAFRVYIPMIVTSSKLAVCSFKPDDVSLEDGKLSDPSIETVDLVRFGKSLVPARDTSEEPMTVEQLVEAATRTVLVTSGSSLEEALGAVGLWGRGRVGPWAK